MPVAADSALRMARSVLRFILTVGPHCFALVRGAAMRRFRLLLLLLRAEHRNPHVVWKIC